MSACPVCGDEFTDLTAFHFDPSLGLEPVCSGACARIVRFAERAAGRRDPMTV